ncbi:MAG: pentapeptide repeat-containing protein [Chloroflexota bacterium]
MSLRGTHLGGTHFQQAEWLRVQAADSDLSNTRWDRALLRHVLVRGSRLVGLMAPEALLEDVIFQQCDLSLAQLRFCRFKDVRFEDCQLREADFAASDISGTVFERCGLDQVDMSQATAAGIDLRGSSIEGIKVLLTQLREAKVEFDQAVYLVRLMGIHVGADQ